MSSSSDVKLEAPKFIHDSSSNSSSSSTMATGNDKDKKDFKASSKEDNIDSSHRESGSSFSASKDTVSSSERKETKHPSVVLKLSKQDNGTYYKKHDLFASSAGAGDTSPRKEQHRHATGGAAGYNHSSSSVSISSVSSSSKSGSAKEPQRKGSADGNNVPDSTAIVITKDIETSGRREPHSNSRENTSSSSVSVKLESVEMEKPATSKSDPTPQSKSEMALYAMKKTTCSVTLDKTKIDVKLSSSSRFSNGDSYSKPMDFSSSSSSSSPSSRQLKNEQLSTAAAANADKGGNVESTTADSSTASPSSAAVTATAVTSATITTRTSSSPFSSSATSAVTITAEKKKRSANHLDTDPAGSTTAAANIRSEGVRGGGVTIEQIAPKKLDR
jgi:hypothetical protein